MAFMVYDGYADTRIFSISVLLSVGMEPPEEDLVFPQGRVVEVSEQVAEFLMVLGEDFREATEAELQVLEDELEDELSLEESAETEGN